MCGGGCSPAHVAQGRVVAAVAVQGGGQWPMSHSGPSMARASPAQPHGFSPTGRLHGGTISAGFHESPFG